MKWLPIKQKKCKSKSGRGRFHFIGNRILERGFFNEYLYSQKAIIFCWQERRTVPKSHCYRRAIRCRKKQSEQNTLLCSVQSFTASIWYTKLAAFSIEFVCLVLNGVYSFFVVCSHHFLLFWRQNYIFIYNQKWSYIQKNKGGGGLHPLAIPL